MPTNYEQYFGTPEAVVDTMQRKLGQCLMGTVFGAECTRDAAVSYRCPFYNRKDCTEAMIEWLEEEA